MQSHGTLDDAFRARLKSAGATIVSYIPNNAYLVRVSEAGANQMRSLPQTQSVLPWEPYYKLDLSLLNLAVQNQPLPDGTKLNVLVFPGEREAAIKSFTDLGAKILGEDRSPFGHQLIIDPSPQPSPREGRGSSAPMSSPAPSASPSPSPLNGERAGVRGENDPGRPVCYS